MHVPRVVHACTFFGTRLYRNGLILTPSAQLPLYKQRDSWAASRVCIYTYCEDTNYFELKQ